MYEGSSSISLSTSIIFLCQVMWNGASVNLTIMIWELVCHISNGCAQLIWNGSVHFLWIPSVHYLWIVLAKCFLCSFCELLSLHRNIATSENCLDIELKQHNSFWNYPLIQFIFRQRSTKTNHLMHWMCLRTATIAKKKGFTPEVQSVIVSKAKILIH